MSVELAVLLPTVAGTGAVIGWLGKHFSNGRLHKGDEAAAAEFRGEMRAIMKALADTQSKAVDLMGDVHSEIAHTNEVLTLLEARGRGSEEAIRKILGR